jgi:polysaccharide pyruvyl transferase WcaK-like protein
MGVIAGVPVAGIAYENKVRKFCQRYNIPCFNYGENNGKEIVESMRVADIDLTAERNKIDVALKVIKKDIESYL